MVMQAVTPSQDGDSQESEQQAQQAQQVAPTAASLGRITTRPSVAEDSAFMLELYASNSKQQLDDLGWSIGSQRTFVIMEAQAEEYHRARQYPGMDRLTICVDDMPVGRLLVCLRHNILHLVDLSLLPRYRGLGIGTQLMGEIIGEARNARVPIKVRVNRDSGTVRFVERLGFGSPTELGRQIEYTWMPPLTALGPDAREDGFASHGTRANRSASEVDPLTDASWPTASELTSEPAAERDPERVAEPVAAALAEPVEDTLPLPSRGADLATEVAPASVDRVDDQAAEPASTGVAAFPLPPQAPVFDEPPAGSENIVEPDTAATVEATDVAGDEAGDVAGDVAGDKAADEFSDEVTDQEAEEPVDTTYEDTLAATDAFTAGLTSSFSGELPTEEPEDEEFDFGFDRYDPFS